MEDYRVKISVQNNLLLELIKKDNKSVKAFSENFGLDYMRVNATINLRLVPVTKDGNFTTFAKELCGCLGVNCEDVFPLRIIEKYGIKNSVTINTNSVSSIRFETESMLIENTNDVGDKVSRESVVRLIKRLHTTSRSVESDLKMLLMYHGVESKEHTLKEIAEYFGITSERVRIKRDRAMRSIYKQAAKESLSDNKCTPDDCKTSFGALVIELV